MEDDSIHHVKIVIPTGLYLNCHLSSRQNQELSVVTDTVANSHQFLCALGPTHYLRLCFHDRIQHMFSINQISTVSDLKNKNSVPVDVDLSLYLHVCCYITYNNKHALHLNSLVRKELEALKKQR